MKSLKIWKKFFLLSLVCTLTFTSCATEEFTPTDESSEASTEEDVANKANPLANFKTKTSWHDSFSFKGKCYCKSTYDHGIGKFKVGGKTVRSICEAMKKEMQKALKSKGKKVYYNTVQCGHAPAHKDKTIKVKGKKHADEVHCPGEVRNGLKCNSRKGPKWSSKGDDNDNNNNNNNNNNGNNSEVKLSFSTPSNNSSLKVGYDRLYIKAKTSGDIKEISLYIDGKFIRTEKVKEYEWGQTKYRKETRGLKPGTHTLKLVAKDSKGKTKESSIKIKVRK